MDKILKKFFITPGFCTKLELTRVKKFILKFIEIRDIYKLATNHDPIGQTLESKLDCINWHIDFKNKKKIKYKIKL
jgi:hypothetical protein